MRVLFGRRPLPGTKRNTPSSRNNTKLHDEAERDRKRGDGDFRHRRIEEPSLVIHTQLPEDEEQARQEQVGVVELTGNGVDGGGTGEAGLGGATAVLGGVRGADGAQEPWALVTEEVRFRLKSRRRNHAIR